MENRVWLGSLSYKGHHSRLFMRAPLFTCDPVFVNAQITKLIDYIKWLLSFIDDGKLIPIEEEVFVST